VGGWEVASHLSALSRTLQPGRPAARHAQRTDQRNAPACAVQCGSQRCPWGLNAPPPVAHKTSTSTHKNPAAAAGAKTGRSPRDKRVVRDPSVNDDIWWAAAGTGSPNHEMDERWGTRLQEGWPPWPRRGACGGRRAAPCCPRGRRAPAPSNHACCPVFRAVRSFNLNRETAVSYLNSLERVFVFDGYANWDTEVGARAAGRAAARPQGACHRPAYWADRHAGGP
jgi:hypothetical protein